MLSSAPFLLVSILIGLPGGLEKEKSVTPEEFVWRAEYIHAVSTLQDTSVGDRATYLMMAGRAEDAFEIFSGGRDPFERGVVAFKAGRYAESLDLTRDSRENDYLEAYRLYYRAVSHFKLGSYAEAVSELETLFGLFEGNPPLEGHPVFIDSKNLYAEAFVRSPEHNLPIPVDFDCSSVTAARTYLILSRASHDGGLVNDAKRFLLECVEAEIDTTTGALLSEMIQVIGSALHEFDKNELVSIADFALKIPSKEAAGSVIKILLEHYGNEYETRLVRGRWLASTGEKRRALKVYRNIFTSQAPVALKKDALLQAASLEHTLKQYEAAAESYRIFGMYYPGDPRSAHALDIAARIEVLRRKWNRALAIWEVLRLRGLSSSIHKEAALSEAVLLYTMGETEKSHTILKELLPATEGLIEAATLYWLQLSCRDEGQKKSWSERLILRYPRSLYTSVLKNGVESSLFIPEQVDGNDELLRIQLMESTERDFFDAIDSVHVGDEIPFSHPAYQAFGLFLRIGALGDAAACAEILKIQFGRNRELLSLLYRHARAAGMADVGLAILNAQAFFNPRKPFPRELYYPVAFSTIIVENAIERQLPVDLIFAVIREESRFDPHAVSRAGAVGLMQLMPSTGRWIGTKIGIQEVADDDLHTPGFNIDAGSWFLRFQLDRCGGTTVAALAAYNAGGSRMAKWRKMFTPEKSPMVAIEMIGIRETRTYVRRVLDSMAAYQSIYGKQPEAQ